MKIVTWNVNGIRARGRTRSPRSSSASSPTCSACRRSRPRVDHIPSVGDLPGYWCYWHGTKGYSGVALLVSSELARPSGRSTCTPSSTTRRASPRPRRRRDRWSRRSTCRTAAKTSRAKLRFLEAMVAYAAALRATGDAVVLCGDINVARTSATSTRRSATTGAIGQLPRGAGAVRAHPRRGRAARRRPRARSRQRRPVHLVGALAQHAPAQHRVAARLRARQRRAGGDAPELRRRSARSAPAITRRWWRPSREGAGS